MKTNSPRGMRRLDANPPAVYVSTVPAELLVTRGEPMYAPISKTNLLYVTNSDNEIFMDTKTQRHFTLLAGRWFRASHSKRRGSGYLATMCREISN
jgi:hypothetical protein